MERRLAAILAADVVGYSRLMSMDEAGTLKALKTVRADVIDPKIAQHGGRIFKTTGDGVLAEFPSVVNAVSCAVDVQRVMASRSPGPIRLRIGINLGDVLVEDGDVFGDGVNLAARVEGVAAPGGVALSAAAFEHVGNRLALQFDNMGEHSLKNIDRPIQIYSVRLDGTPTSARSEDAPPSIAVLPFTNMSNDPEQEFFADGLSEDLITDLSRVPGLFVIARHSSFAYKGRAIDVRQAARELGVKYVVEGSVRRSASRIRITVQFIDAVSGGHVWADRFDRALDDVFELQDEVVGRIVTALVNALPPIRLVAKRRAANIAAYDLFARGRAMTLLTLPDPKRSARALLEKAIELDPGFADAHAWLAMNLVFQWIDGEQQADERATILAEAEMAVSLDPANADGYFVRGYALTYNGELSAARVEFERALAANPNHANAWLFLGDLEVLDGHPEAAIRAVEMAFKLDPYPHPTYYWLMGFARYAAGQYEQALEPLEHHSCRETGAERILAAALAQLGRVDEARAAARRFMSTYPQFTIASWTRTQPFRNPKDLQHFVDGYIKAGLPS